VKRAILFIMLGGCAGSYQPSGPVTDEPERDVSGYEARIAELQSELDRVAGDSQPDMLDEEDAASSAQSPECRAGADLSDRICDLAERICAVADRDPSAVEIYGKCERSRAACRDAQSRVDRSCNGH